MTENEAPAQVQPPPSVRARVLLRKGVRGKDVAQELANTGIDEQQAQSIVKTELDSFRRKAGVLLTVGLIIALIALVASLRSYFKYLDMRNAFGYHVFYFYPLPLLIGVVFSIVAVTKLRKFRW